MERNVICGPELKLESSEGGLGQHLFERLKAHPPEKVLLEEADTRRTFKSSEYLSGGISVANELKRLGIKQEEVVAIAGQNGIDIYTTMLGCMFQGIPVTLMDSCMTVYELQHSFRILTPVLIFCDYEWVKGIADALAGLKMEVPITVYDSPENESNYRRFEELVKTPGNPDTFVPALVKDNNKSTCVIPFSSGTTGPAKAVMLSDKSLLLVIRVWTQTLEKLKLLDAPLLQPSYAFWMASLFFYATLTSLGLKRVIIKRVTVERTLQAIHNSKPGWILTSPSFLARMTAHPGVEKYDLHSLKLLIVAGSALQPVYVDRFRKYLSSDAQFIQLYGMTEIGEMGTLGIPGQDIISVGKVVPGIKIKIADPEGSALGPGETGEICFKTPQLMNGYVKNEESTKASLDKDGWYHSGDIGYYNDQEMFFFTGRIKELLLYESRHVEPSELESVISYVPGVSDVGVAGIEVDSGTTHLVALVVKELGSNVSKEDIIKCVDDNLSDHKRLRGGVYFVEQIPRTPTGKIRRLQLQQLVDSLSEKKI